MSEEKFITEEHGLLLAARARRQLENKIGGKKTALEPLPDELSDKVFPAFVTLFKKGQLQGCIGNIDPKIPVGALIPDLAMQSAGQDPRFDGVTAEDVDELDIEVSLLSPFESINGPEDIELGKHGIMLEKGWSRGLFLPEVATEHNMSLETFFEHLGLKAGLYPDAYKEPGVKLFKFTTQIFWNRAKGA